MTSTVPHPQGPQLAPPPYMHPFPLALQLKMKRFYGHIFLAPNRLYFVCGRQGGAWAAAIGQSLGGVVGGALVALGTPGAGNAPPVVDESQVQAAIVANPGSMIFEASQLTMIKHTMFWRLFKWQGQTVGLPQGMSKDLKAALGPWARYHNVPTKGL